MHMDSRMPEVVGAAKELSSAGEMILLLRCAAARAGAPAMFLLAPARLISMQSAIRIGYIDVNFFNKQLVYPSDKLQV